MNDDMALVRAYATDQSEPAFETLAARYVNLVYSTAVRQVCDPHLAEEITQVVFIILARKAGGLGPHTIVPSWLHRTAGFVAADALKRQRRREHREQEAQMQSTLNEPESEAWPQIAPLLDAAIARLNEKDRHAVVLRFFENKSLSEIGDALGASEDAAKMRVSRALEKLRLFFLKRGINSTAATIAATISANSVQAAPTTLANSVAAVAVTKGAAASSSTLALMNGAMKIMAWANLKTAAVIGAVIVLAAGAATTLIAHHVYQAGVIDLPQSSLAFAGYGSPQATLRTLLWANDQLNRKAILDGLSADFQKDLQEYVDQNKATGVTLGDFLSRKVSLTGAYSDVRIERQEVLSPNQALLLVDNLDPFESNSGSHWIKFKKFGHDWKLDDLDPKGGLGRLGVRLDNQFGGIGVTFDFEPGTHTPSIAKVLPALALSQTNLVPGLVVQKINGTSTAGKSLSECVFKTRGRVGTDVVLELFDPKSQQTNIVELTRKRFSAEDFALLGNDLYRWMDRQRWLQGLR